MNSDKKKLPGEAYSEKIRARFWITGDQGGYLGIGRVQLLEKISELGSISQAAKSMGMSYKKAWMLVQELNGMYDEALIDKEVGGKSGGGSVLTPKGKRVIHSFRRIEEELEIFLKERSTDI